MALSKPPLSQVAKGSSPQSVVDLVDPEDAGPKGPDEEHADRGCALHRICILPSEFHLGHLGRARVRSRLREGVGSGCRPVPRTQHGGTRSIVIGTVVDNQKVVIWAARRTSGITSGKFFASLCAGMMISGRSAAWRPIRRRYHNLCPAIIKIPQNHE